MQKSSSPLLAACGLLPVCEGGGGDLATMIQQGLIFLGHLWEAEGKSCEASLHTSIHTSWFLSPISYFIAHLSPFFL